MGVRPTIRLTLPATLRHRSLAVRLIAEACRMISAPNSATHRDDASATYDLRHPFDAEFVSAFAEIFNNIVIHAYQRREDGEVELVITTSHDALHVEIRDHGQPFDISAVPEPELESLPEGGMGIHIARALLDEVVYEPGPPNLWRLSKRLRRTEAPGLASRA
jgi:anti-sigma regulatory factor (Ser/Thr protein kinase)